MSEKDFNNILVSRIVATKNFKSIVRYILGGIFFLVLLTYGYFRGYTLIHGGSLTVDGIHDGENTGTNFVVLTGSATHAKELLINGRTVSTDENGKFTDPLILLPGYNVITVLSKDTFGHTSEMVLHSYYEPHNTETVALVK